MKNKVFFFVWMFASVSWGAEQIPHVTIPLNGTCKYLNCNKNSPRGHCQTVYYDCTQSPSYPNSTNFSSVPTSSSLLSTDPKLNTAAFVGVGCFMTALVAFTTYLYCRKHRRNVRQGEGSGNQP